MEIVGIRRPYWKVGRTVLVLATSLALFAIEPAPAAAQICPGNNAFGITRQAINDTFPKSVTCAAGIPYGMATVCFKFTGTTDANSNALVARWPNITARLSDATGGCRFNCNVGSCRVGGDGLPVELLQFGVE